MHYRIVMTVLFALLAGCNFTEKPQPAPPQSCSGSAWQDRVDNAEFARLDAEIITGVLKNSNSVVPNCIAVIREQPYPVTLDTADGGGFTKEEIRSYLHAMLNEMSAHPFLNETRIEEITDDFFEANKVSRGFRFSDFDRNEAFRILEQSRYQGWLEEGNDFWPSLHSYYPTELAFWQFSYSGLDTNGQFALIYSGMQCSPLCGEGQLILLERMDIGDGTYYWTVIAARTVWIS